MRTPFLLFCLSLVSACTILDPHNIVGRTAVPGFTPNVPVVDTNSTAWKREAFEQVWNTVNEKYYDPAFGGVNWRDARSKYEAQIFAAESDDRYWELLDQMTGVLKDSHTRVHSAKQAAQQRNQEAHSLGLGFLEINGALVVTSVHAESDPWWAGVRAGMTIKLIEGEPALARYRRLLDEVRESSTPWARTRGAIRKITAGDPDTVVNMTFTRQDGSDIAATMKRRKFRAPSEFTQRLLPSGFAYVRFSGFEGSMETAIVNAIDGMKASPGMIVDLRNNGGGSGSMAASIVTKFLSETKQAGRVLTRTGQPVRIAFVPVVKIEPEYKGRAESAYTKPLVILTNENSASASEIVASALQDFGRATIIGQRTCGCLLGYLGYANLPGGGLLAYSELGFVSPKGRRIEGEGVKPDIEIALSQEDILFSRDRILEAAENSLRAKTHSTGKTL